MDWPKSGVGGAGAKKQTKFDTVSWNGKEKNTNSVSDMMDSTAQLLM